MFDTFLVDNISIKHEKNIFMDLSHLNEIGAGILSIELGNRMAKQHSTTYYITSTISTDVYQR